MHSLRQIKDGCIQSDLNSWFFRFEWIKRWINQSILCSVCKERGHLAFSIPEFKVTALNHPEKCTVGWCSRGLIAAIRPCWSAIRWLHLVRWIAHPLSMLLCSFFQGWDTVTLMKMLRVKYGTCQILHSQYRCTFYCIFFSINAIEMLKVTHGTCQTYY